MITNPITETELTYITICHHYKYCNISCMCEHVRFLDRQRTNNNIQKKKHRLNSGERSLSYVEKRANVQNDSESPQEMKMKKGKIFENKNSKVQYNKRPIIAYIKNDGG